MMFEISGDLVICDPLTVKDVKPILEFKSGVGSCFETIHPVEDYKAFISNREYYIKEKLNLAYSGYIPRSIGRLGTDSGKFAIFKLDDIKNPSVLKKGENFKIKDFKGKIGVFYDLKGMIHIYTSGNYNFYTI